MASSCLKLTAAALLMFTALVFIEVGEAFPQMPTHKRTGPLAIEYRDLQQASHQQMPTHKHTSPLAIEYRDLQQLLQATRQQIAKHKPLSATSQQVHPIIYRQQAVSQQKTHGMHPLHTTPGGHMQQTILPTCTMEVKNKFDIFDHGDGMDTPYTICICLLFLHNSTNVCIANIACIYAAYPFFPGRYCVVTRYFSPLPLCPVNIVDEECCHLSGVDVCIVPTKGKQCHSPWTTKTILVV